MSKHDDDFIVLIGSIGMIITYGIGIFVLMICF